MGMKCAWNGHQWSGCRCTLCGKQRDEEHQLTPLPGQCRGRCAVCGKEKEMDHQFADLPERCVKRCVVCGKEEEGSHLWTYGEEAKTCARCGKQEALGLENMGVQKLQKLREQGVPLQDHPDLVPMLTFFDLFRMILHGHYSGSYQFPFETVWSGDYPQPQIDRYIQGRVFTGYATKQAAADKLMMELNALAGVRPRLEQQTNNTFWCLLNLFAPDSLEGFLMVAHDLTDAEKLQIGKEIFQEAYEGKKLTLF